MARGSVDTPGTQAHRYKMMQVWRCSLQVMEVIIWLQACAPGLRERLGPVGPSEQVVVSTLAVAVTHM